MRIGKRIRFLLMLLFLTALLAGCTKVRVQVETDLTLNQDCSGEREITMTVEKKAFDKYFEGSIEQLEAVIADNIPSEFEWRSCHDDKKYQYIFSLPFDSIEEYKEKAAAVTGGEALVTMEEPGTVFASGLRYKENFTTHDMLGWFEQALMETKYLEVDIVQSLLEETRTTVIHKNKEFHAQGGAIAVDNVVETPLERLDVLTQYFQNEECSRQVVFSFTGESMSRNGDAIREYLESCTDESASGVWTENGDMRYFTVSAEKLSAEELDAFMKRLSDSEETFVSKKILHEAKIFHGSAQWNEYLDLSAFAYNENYRIPLGYYVQWEDGMELSVQNQGGKKNLELAKSELYGGYQMVLEKEVSDINLITSTKSIYTIREIEVNTKIMDKNQAERTTTLLFTRTPEPAKQKMIRKSIAQLAQGYAEVVIESEREDGIFAISILQNNTIDRLNEGFEKIFGVRGTLSHVLEGQLMDLKHEGGFSDVVDFTGFIENDPMQTILTYNLELAGGETIKKDSISSTALLKDEAETVDANTYSCSIPGAYLSLTFNSTAWNPHAMKLIFLGLCILGLFLCVIAMSVFMGRKYVDARTWRERFDDDEGDDDGGYASEYTQEPEKKKGRKGLVMEKIKSFFMPPEVDCEEDEFEADEGEAVYEQEEETDYADEAEADYVDEEEADYADGEEADYADEAKRGSKEETSDFIPEVHRMNDIPLDDANW